MFSWSWKDKQLTDLNRQKIQRNFGTYVVLLAALGAMTFFGVCNPSRRAFQNGMSLSGSGGAAADVAGDRVSDLEFRRAYQNAYNRMQEQYRESFDPGTMRLASMVLGQLVDERVMYRQASAAGLVVGDDEIMKTITDARMFADDKGRFNEEAFTNFLRGNQYTEATFMEEVRRNLTVSKFRQFMLETSFVSSKAAEVDFRLAEAKIDIDYLKFDPNAASIAVSDAEIQAFVDDSKNAAAIKDYYGTHQSEYKQPQKVHARHVLVSFSGARNASGDGKSRSKDDARKRAEDVLGKVRAPGADFVAIAKEMTDEASGKSSGGDLGFFTREAMVKEFSDKAFALKAGEISDIVESPFGFHVIKVEAIQAPKDETIEQARVGIARVLIEKEKRAGALDAKAAKILETLRAGQDATALIAEAGVAWASTGGFSPGSGYVPGLGSDKALQNAVGALNAQSPLAPSVVTVGGTRYILRFKSRQDADMAKFAGSEHDRLVKSASYTQAYSMFQAVEKQARAELEKKGRIWMNPEYLAIDDRKGKAAEGPQDGSNEI